MSICPKCNAQVNDGVKFCQNCGAKMESNKIVCATCGNELSSSAKFCNVCGTPVSKPEQATEQTINPVQTQPIIEAETAPATAEQPVIPNVEVKPDVQTNQSPIPDYINPASTEMPGVTPGKKGASAIIPVILIILILAVICVDVFFLFKDEIFGKDSATDTHSISVVTDVSVKV